jgi:hypothetical protein
MRFSRFITASMVINASAFVRPVAADTAQFLGAEQQHDDDCDDQQLPNTDTTHDFLSG